MEDWEGKTAFITGGVSGIGLGLAKAFAEAGMNLVLTYMSRDHMEEARNFFSDRKESVHFIPLDVTDREAFARAADETEDVFGPVNLLCNNAGIGIKGKLCDSDFRDWDWGLNVNLGGVINGIMTFLPQLRRHREGAHILTISSMSGLFATPNCSIYNTAKFAVMGLMETLRSEMVEENIGVSVACPGLVRTNIYKGLRLRPAAYQHDNVPEMTEEYLNRGREIMSKGMDPLEYGRRVLQGIRRNELFILTHPEFEQGIRDRFETILSALPDEVPDPDRVALEAQFTLRNKIYYR